MRTKNLVIGVLALICFFVIGYFILLNALSGMGNPTGGRGPDYPYFITTETLKVKGIVLPKGTKLTYEEQLFKEGQQDKIMDEKKLTSIELPEGKTIAWAGVPINRIDKFYNPEMRGFSVNPDFNQLPDHRKNKFSEMWQSCGDGLSVLVKNIDDWTFNTKNITDVSSCSVNYQRYFKDDTVQQTFLDSLYRELKKISPDK